MTVHPIRPVTRQQVVCGRCSKPRPVTYFPLYRDPEHEQSPMRRWCVECLEADARGQAAYARRAHASGEVKRLREDPATSGVVAVLDQLRDLARDRDDLDRLLAVYGNADPAVADALRGAATFLEYVEGVERASNAA